MPQSSFCFDCELPILLAFGKIIIPLNSVIFFYVGYEITLWNPKVFVGLVFPICGFLTYGGL